MVLQIDLFPAPRALPTTCGTCVHRNALPAVGRGFCAPAGEERDAGANPCDQGFGFEQLIKATTLQEKKS